MLVEGEGELCEQGCQRGQVAAVVDDALDSTAVGVAGVIAKQRQRLGAELVFDGRA